MRREDLIMTNFEFSTIDENNLAEIKGGANWGSVAKWFLNQASQHLDEIGSGYKSGYKSGRNSW